MGEGRLSSVCFCFCLFPVCTFIVNFGPPPLEPLKHQRAFFIPLSSLQTLYSSFPTKSLTAPPSRPPPPELPAWREPRKNTHASPRARRAANCLQFAKLTFPGLGIPMHNGDEEIHE